MQDLGLLATFAASFLQTRILFSASVEAGACFAGTRCAAEPASEVWQSRPVPGRVPKIYAQSPRRLPTLRRKAKRRQA